MTDYVLVGGGAFSRELHDWFAPGLPESDRFVGYLDDGDLPMAAFGRDLPQLGDTRTYVLQPGQKMVMAVGDPKGKQALAGRLGGPEAFATLVHPRAWVSASAKLGPGAVVGPFADVSADSQAGVLLTLNGYSSLGHDVTVGDFVTLSGYVDLTGGVTVGDRSFFGSGARVLPRLKLGSDCTVGAGAVVVRGCEDGVTFYAAPARRL